jgi:DNA-directed RNA polymerase subunit RPC12/RpoP
MKRARYEHNEHKYVCAMCWQTFGSLSHFIVHRAQEVKEERAEREDIDYVGIAKSVRMFRQDILGDDEGR